jgi:hypothetical protein
MKPWGIGSDPNPKLKGGAPFPAEFKFWAGTVEVDLIVVKM